MGMLSEALNPIKILGRQAKSYTRSVGAAAIRTSSTITKDALSHGLTYYAAGGAALGGAVGGYDAYNNGGSVAGGVLKGAAIGGAAGAGARLGLSAYGSRGRASLRTLGRRMGGAVPYGAAQRAAGSTNYFRAMGTEFKMAGGFGAMKTGFAGAGRQMYNRAATVGRRAANTPMGNTAAGYAGRAAGAVRGAADWVRGGGIGATAGPIVDKAMYSAGL